MGSSVEFLEGNRVRLSGGQVIANVHSVCGSTPCVIHSPSDHELSSLKLYFNGGSMVRVSDDGEFFIDPDDYAFRKNGEAIVRNAARCRLCGDTIESWSVHDYVTCSCGECSVDGGGVYLRHGAKHWENFEDLSIEL